MVTKLSAVYVPVKRYNEYVNAYKNYVGETVFSSDTLKSSVKGFKVISRHNNTIVLSWSAHINEKVTDYVVLRNGEKVATTTECRYIDLNIDSGSYTYSVYGVTADNEVTAFATLSTSTTTPELIDVYTNHINNSVGPTDGRIFISAKNNKNFCDLEGNEIKGKLYYVVNGERIFIGTSLLNKGSITTSKLIYTVNWDVTDIDAGEYKVVFVIEDIDGASDELEGTINVNKSVPEKLVNVVAVGDFTKINLSWSQSSEVDSTTYKIYRKSEVDTKYYLVKTINNRTTLTYTDTNVKEDRLYYYYVVTENSFGTQSEPSEIAVAMRATDTEPPTVTKFAPATNSFITKTQTVAVSAVDNLVATSVKLYYSVDDEATWTLVGEDAIAPFNFSFDTTKLSDGIVTLKAVAYDAEGNESLPKTAKYSIDNTGPEKVTGVSAKEILTSKVTLEWNDVSDNDAACFVLQKKTDDGYHTISSSITTLGYNLNDLYPGTTYTYRVAAMDVRGNIGVYSDEFSVTTKVDEIAPVITSLVPYASRHNNSIQFRASAGDDSGIKSIKIQVSTDRVNWKDLSTANYSTYNKTATYAYTISLADYRDGSIFVRAIASDHSGNLSDTSDSAAFVEYIVDKTAPDKPRDLIASGGDGWIYVSWLQGEEDDLSTYSLYRSTSENGAYSLIASNLNKTSYYDTTAQRDVVYYYKLRVLDSTGNLSDFSEAVSAKVADDITAPEVISINPSSGSFVGPGYRLVEALIKDNNCIDNIVFEYRINDDAEFKTLKKINNVGYYYTTARVDLPIEELTDGDKICIRVFATDIVGLTSEYSAEYIYLVDKVAPTLSNLAVVVENDNCKITWSNSAETDVSGFKVYRVNADSTFTYLGSRSYSYNKTYSFYDFVYSLGDGDYSYKVEACDRVGNYNSYFTDPVHYERAEPDNPDDPDTPKVNEAPKAVITGFETMEIGVEEFFDAGYSTDDNSIVSYKWDFGDGTTSDQVKVIKKFKLAGIYTVTLTVTDDEGESSSDTIEVTVNERVAVGTVKVNVVDENGKPVANAPVYFGLGEEGQKKIFSDGNGVASLLMEKGDHPIGVYKSGYLPVQKTVTVLPNATRVITMTIIEQEIVTGKFEVTRMTFSEIKAAGIDVYSPANQNVYKVEVQIKYEGSTVPVTYIRNDSKIISYSVGNSGGSGGSRPSGSGGSGGSGVGRTIVGLSFIPNEENKEIVAVLDMPVEVSYLKEFFDVRLHIINNAAPEFRLVDNDIHLNVPEGLTMMKGLTGDWYESPDVTIDTIVGQETKTLSWILRGDKQGDYDLTAEFNGTLDVFNEQVSATFKTDEPIKVYGLSAIKFKIDVNDEIKYNALYFDFGIENITDIDIYNPTLDFDGIVSNVTASAKQSSDGVDTSEGKADYDVESTLLNVRVEYNDGTTQYVPFSWNNNGSVTTDVDTLSPGDSIYYEYVAYNVVDYDDIARFAEASKNVISGYSDHVEVNSVSMNLFSVENAVNKLESAFEESSTGSSVISSDYDVSDSTFSADFDSQVKDGKYKSAELEFLYNDCFFDKLSTSGINNGLAVASMYVASTAYSGSGKTKALLGSMGYDLLSSYNYTSSETKGKKDYVAYNFGSKKITVNDKTFDTVIVAVRGTPGSIVEWESNFNMGTNGKYHEGFTKAAEEVYASLEKYLTENQYNKDSTKIWLVGHSRGAAVANIVAEKLTKLGKYATTENIYAYTFATPMTSVDADESLNNIINYCNKDDLISSVPLAKWGFKRAGKTVNFNMSDEAKRIFYGMTNKTYIGNSKTSGLAESLYDVVPTVSSYYSLDMDNVFSEVVKFIVGKTSEIDFQNALKGIIASAVDKPIEFIDFVKYLIEWLLFDSGQTAIYSAHCQEAYISYLTSVHFVGGIVTDIKKSKNEVISEFDISKNNALNYILDDGNYLYINNSSWFDKSLQTVYNGFKLGLTLDLNTITKEEQKKIARTFILELITNSGFEENIEELVNTQYCKVIKGILGNIKTTTSLMDNASIISIANDILGNESKINSLASTLKTSGSDGLQSTLYKEFASNIATSAVLEALRIELSVVCSPDGIASCFLETMSFSSELVGDLLEFTIKKPLELINDVEYARHINAILNLYACDYEANLLLDTIINSKSDDNLLGLLDNALQSFSLLGHLDTDVEEIVIDTAKEMKKEMQEEFKAELEALKKIIKDAVESQITSALTEATKSLLGPAYVWYVLLSASFKLVDRGLGISAYYERVDTFNIATYITSALLLGYEKRVSAFNKKTNISKFLEALQLDDLFKFTYLKDKNMLAKDALYLLKGICNCRLLGEQSYKKALEKNNVNLLHGDAEYDYGVLQAANSKFGTSYDNVEELYDYIYGNILKARDTVFNIEEKTDVEKPTSPVVTFNYDTMTTNESFDDTYEYCLSNGEWIKCSGGTIPVKLKTTSTILRVRKASGRNTVAGEITTITLYAQREFSKVVSVKYDNGKYYFTNLLSIYDYQITTVDSANATVDWNDSKIVHGKPDASVSYSYGKYLAIRTCPNSELKETTSQTRVLPVAIKQKLTVNTWGNGAVSQTDETGKYFVGDEIKLIAKPDEGAIFKGWYIDNELVSRDSEYLFEMYNYAEISAKFEGGEEVLADSVEIVLADIDEQATKLMSTFRFRTVPRTSVYEGFTAKLVANVYPQNTTDKTVIWSTSDDDIAVVDANGVVKFIKSGDVTITATLGNDINSSYNFAVLENSIVDFRITEQANRTWYYENENIDLTGLKVVAEYISGDTEEIAKYTVSGFDNTEGKKTVTLTYENFTVDFEVEVIHKTQWIESIAPTCISPGTEIDRCIICNAETRTREIEMIAHSCEWLITKDATESENGLREYICKDCGTSTDSESIEWCDHKFTENTIQVTCEVDGYTSYSCSECGYTYTDNYIDAIGHNYEMQIVEPGCEKVGYTINKCKNCGDKLISDYMDALEHKFVEEKIISTCIEKGGILHKCTLCGCSYKTDETDLIAHDYTSEKIEPTCVEGGCVLFTCKMCNDTFKADETLALGHKYVSEETNGNCTEGSFVVYKCSVCDDEYSETIKDPAEHIFGEWIVRTPSDEGHAGVKYRLCTKCNYEETADIPVIDHEHIKGEWYTAKEPSCEVYGLKVQKCSECFEVVASEVIEAIGHNYSEESFEASCENEGYKLLTCKTCNHTQKDNVKPALGHDFSDWEIVKEATCTQNGLHQKKCSTCDRVEEETISAKGHQNTRWIEISKATCTEIGVKKLVCSDCGQAVETESVPPSGHRYKTTTIAATCEKAGRSDYTCSVCNDVYSETLQPLGHSYEKYTVDVEASCIQYGFVTGNCTRCDSEITIVVPPIEHIDSDDDNLCDVCQDEFYTDDDCRCICHAGGYSIFVYRIIRILWKLFRSNQVCSCGTNHY